LGRTWAFVASRLQRRRHRRAGRRNRRPANPSLVDGGQLRIVGVDHENGEQLRELNSTEEGRKRVDISDLPGNVKSAIINEAHNKEPKRVWQVTRGRDTTYVGEASDGHLVRIDSDGKVISHDANPKLLDNADNRNLDNTNRNRNRDNSSNDNNRFERDRNLDLKNADKVEFGNLPNDVKDTIRQETRRGEKIADVYKVKTDNGTIHYIIKTDDGRTIRVGEHGGLLGQTR